MPRERDDEEELTSDDVRIGDAAAHSHSAINRLAIRGGFGDRDVLSVRSILPTGV